MLYYLPGCGTNRNHTAAGRKMVDYMKSRGAKLAKCCKLDVDYYRPGDTVVQNCTQCSFMLRERCPQITVTSLYEFVLGDPGFRWADLGGRRMTLQDCFRMRGDAAFHDAVRQCLRRLRVSVVETEENRADAKFCGVWLNEPADPRCAAVAPKSFKALEAYRHILSEEEKKAAMRAWVSRYTTEDTVVYCNGCEKGLRLGGGKPTHLLELLAAGY